jgi:hypothetical protein
MNDNEQIRCEASIDTYGDERFLTLDELISRLCSGEPVRWVTAQDGDNVYDMVMRG